MQIWGGAGGALLVSTWPQNCVTVLLGEGAVNLFPKWLRMPDVEVVTIMSTVESPGLK